MKKGCCRVRGRWGDEARGFRKVVLVSPIAEARAHRSEEEWLKAWEDERVRGKKVL